MVNLIRYDNTGTARFVTFSCYRRLRNFASDKNKAIFIEYLQDMRRRHPIRLYGYVIMLTHVHLVLRPIGTIKLSVIIGQLKSLSARAVFASLPGERRGEGVFWQRRYYDHNCRQPKYVVEKIRYCHNNPVVAGLVSHPSEWQWSSYNWYHGQTNVPIEMDEFDVPIEQA